MGLILIFSVPTTTSTITILPILGIDWKHYKHPLPEHVYDVYIKYWGLSTFLVHMNCDLSSQNSSG
jgi:hypothetical protein